MISILWVLASQIDKLILSFTVSLEQYGVFSLALVAANLMLTMLIPINQILMPRFVKLFADGGRITLGLVVLKAIHLYVCFFSIIGFGLLFFGRELFLLWTNNSDIASRASVFVGCLAIGNFIHGVTNIIFISAYARDDLNEYSKRYLTHVLIFLPVSIYATFTFQESGVVIVWLISAIAFFCHTAIPFLLRIVSLDFVLYAGIKIIFQVMLVIGVMYIFKFIVNVSDYNPQGMFIILCLFFSFLMGINYLITLKLTALYTKP